MWDVWKVIYKDAHAKAQINNSAIKGDQFGAANEAGVGSPLGANKRDTTTHRTAAAEDEFDGGTTEIEGFFDNLASAATNDKAVLAQLDDKNTKLVNTNEELAASVKRLTNETKQLQQEINTLRRQEGRKHWLWRQCNKRLGIYS